MKKTGGEIELDLFDIIRNSEISQLIGGDIYLKDTRLRNSKEEDAIVSFLSGIPGQIQTGVVVVNIYVEGVDNGGGSLVKNTNRCTFLEHRMNELISSIKPTDYKFSLDGTIQTYRVENLDTYFVNTRIKFELKTF